MVADKKVEYLSGSQAKVTITINKAEAQKQYKALLKKYSAQAAIPGFRKGRAPVSMVETKYGKAIKGEALNGLIEESMRETLPQLERKPLGYAQPELAEEPEFDFDKDVVFSLKMDVEPEFKLAAYKGIEAQSYKASVTDNDVQKELERLQDQNAYVTDKADGSAEIGDVANINYIELNKEGGEEAGTKREQFVFTIGAGQTLYDIDEDVKGMKAGQEKEVAKSYAKDYRFEELAGRSVKLKIKANSIKERKIPELDDEFAQDINEKFETLADLKADIKKKLQENADKRTKNKLLDDIVKTIAGKTEIDLPASMVEAEIDMRWRQFARQSGFSEENLLRMLGGNRAELAERWREESEQTAKTRLILNKIIEEEKITASKQEIEEQAERMQQEYGMTREQLQNQLGSQNFLQYIKTEVEDKKLSDMLISSAKITSVKNVSLQELAELDNPKSGESEKTKKKGKAKTQ